jgi:hypothetical protein
MTNICRFGWAGISGMAAFPTLLSRGCSHPSIRTRWRIPLRDLILPLREGIRPSSFRSSRTDRIPRYSSRCTARTPSASILRSRSTNSSVRHSLHTNPRERSAHSVRSTIPPNMGRPQETCTRSPHPRNSGGNCTSAGPNALRATPPRQYPRYKPLRRGKTRSPCTAMRISASRKIRGTLTISRPTRNPILTDIIHLGPSI